MPTPKAFRGFVTANLVSIRSPELAAINPGTSIGMRRIENDPAMGKIEVVVGEAVGSGRVSAST